MIYDQGLLGLIVVILAGYYLFLNWIRTASPSFNFEGVLCVGHSNILFVFMFLRFLVYKCGADSFGLEQLIHT